jgi:coiled-coil domain-containing protein 40
MDYERAHDNFNIAQRLRLEAEQKLAQVNELYNAKKEESAVLRGKVGKAQKELENLMKHYHEIETYNVQLKSDIAVTKKETFTAEDNVANVEKLKKKQDLLIDSMNEESKRLEEQKNVLTAQIISQREETEEAKKILSEAESEMEKVVASKKNLL